MFSRRRLAAAPVADAPEAEGEDIASARPTPRNLALPTPARWYFDLRAISAFALTLTIVALGSWWIAESEIARHARLIDGVRVLAQSYADELRYRIFTAASASWSMGAVAQVFYESSGNSSAAFDTIAHKLIESHRGISVIQLAPGGVITFIHPLTDRDRPALGYSLLVDSVRRPGAVDTIRNFPEQSATIVGPLELLQGGIGMVVRHPLFSTDSPEYLPLLPYYNDARDANNTVDCSPEQRDDNCRFPGPDTEDGEPTFFWGFSQALAYIDDLLDPLNIERLENGTHVVGNLRHFVWQLREDVWNPGLNESEGIFAHSPNAPADRWMADAIEARIVLPEFGEAWTLAIAPRDGWPLVSSDFVQQLALIGLFTLVGGLGMGFIVISSVRATYDRRARVERLEAEKLLVGKEAAAASTARSRLIRTVRARTRHALALSAPLRARARCRAAV